VNSLSYGGGWKKKRASGICARFQMTFFTVLTATVEPFGHSTRGRYQKMTSGCIRREATEKHKVPNVPVLKRTLYITDLRPWERIGIPWEIVRVYDSRQVQQHRRPQPCYQLAALCFHIRLGVQERPV